MSAFIVASPRLPRRAASSGRRAPRCELRPTERPDAPAKSAPIAPYRVEMISSIAHIAAAEWDALADAGCGSPFLRHAWLATMEASGVAAPHTGWQPRHVLLRDPDSSAVVAVAPAYLKTHSFGEFVFDQEWAHAALVAGLEYYPKLLLAVPFTPVSGRRILTADDPHRAQLLALVADALVQICNRLQISSVHVNFCQADEVSALASAGFLLRNGVQYHFTNYKKWSPASSEQHSSALAERVAYVDFNDYLTEFKSKRRINMRRERNIVRNKSNVRIEIVRGEHITADLMYQMFRIYKSTIDKQLYGRQYLTERFFRMLADCDHFKQHICLVLARSTDDQQLIGGTFNILSHRNGGTFYGRYWGCVKEVKYLHFEACYYTAIEYCIQNGLARMEPGAGGGDFKYMRGFEPTVTMSMHYLRDKRLSRAVANYLHIETMHINSVVSEMKEESAIRSKSKSNTKNTSAT